MAEGWARYLKDERIDAASAGIEPHDLNLLAVKVMAEVGVDISNQDGKGGKAGRKGTRPQLNHRVIELGHLYFV